MPFKLPSLNSRLTKLERDCHKRGWAKAYQRNDSGVPVEPKDGELRTIPDQIKGLSSWEKVSQPPEVIESPDGGLTKRKVIDQDHWIEHDQHAKEIGGRVLAEAQRRGYRDLHDLSKRIEKDELLEILDNVRDPDDDERTQADRLKPIYSFGSTVPITKGTEELDQW